MSVFHVFKIVQMNGTSSRKASHRIVGGEKVLIFFAKIINDWTKVWLLPQTLQIFFEPKGKQVA